TRAHDPEAFNYLQAPELDELTRTLGWTLDIHAEYAALGREGMTSGLGIRWLPGRSVFSAAALLLLNAVRREVEARTLTPDPAGRLTLSRTRLYTLLDTVRADYRARWGETGKKHSTEKLLDEVLELWRQWGGIASQDESTLTLEPHLARFFAAYEDEGAAQVVRRGGRRRKGE
uniref:DUF2398 family protein n=1 Tax=Deinococcus sp. TaxID=47478 RepID=UPI0025BB2512